MAIRQFQPNDYGRRVQIRSSSKMTCPTVACTRVASEAYCARQVYGFSSLCVLIALGRATRPHRRGVGARTGTRLWSDNYSTGAREKWLRKGRRLVIGRSGSCHSISPGSSSSGTGCDSGRRRSLGRNSAGCPPWTRWRSVHVWRTPPRKWGRKLFSTELGAPRCGSRRRESH